MKKRRAHRVGEKLNREMSELVHKAYIKQFNLYKGSVRYYTRKVVEDVPNYDKSKHNFMDHHIDHKIPISYGFKNNIKPKNLGHVSNLQFISKEENDLKSSTPLVDELNAWMYK